MDQSATFGEHSIADRASYYSETEQIIADTPEGRFCLIVLDSGGLDDVLATLGPAARDELFRVIAARLAPLSRRGAHIYHIDRDRFAIRWPAKGDFGARQSAYAVLEQVNGPVEVAGVPMLLGPAVGVSKYPRHAGSAEALARTAVTALQMAKQNTERCALYEAAWDAHQQERFALLSDFSQALERDGEVHPYLQPLMHLHRGGCVRAEALVRWNHPERGLLTAGAFVPHLEGTALFRPMTRKILDAAVATARRWRERGDHRIVSINLSPDSLGDQHLGDYLADMLTAPDCPTQQLEFEITENAVLDTSQTVVDQIKHMRDCGVSLAIDDFGTGYSSLKLLVSLPFDTLKIDRSVIQGAMRNNGYYSAVRSTIDLGHKLDMAVVAEGIETEEMAEAARNWGCDCAQGFLYAKPMPEPEFERWLATNGG